MQPASVFVLSDFSTQDTYVAQMKAAVMSFAGYTTPIVDLTHEISRGNVLQGAFHIRTALPHLPSGAVVLAVVDPGVGSSRLGLLAQWQGRFVVAPDNGLISLLGKDATCWKLPDPPVNISSTFHGRDVFAPCAGRISVDPSWAESLEPLDTPVILKIPQPEIQGGIMEVRVVHTDSFGNCILNLEEKDARGFEFSSILIGSTETPLETVDCYSESSSPDSILILSGSQGYMEIAANGDSVSQRLNVFPGSTVRLTLRRT